MDELIIFALPTKLPKEIFSKIDFSNKFIAPQGKIKLALLAKDLTKYKFIIGIGDYSGRDQSNLRLETECHDNTQTLQINNFLEPVDEVIFSKDIGDSYCNFVSFHIMDNINHSRYSFIHVPKKIDRDFASEKINKMIETFLSAKL